MEQSQPQQSQNHMITPIEKIPLKTSGNANDEMNDDPMIRDVLNEFEKELAITETTNKYKINDQIPVQQIQQPIMQPIQAMQQPQPVVKAKKNKCYIHL